MGPCNFLDANGKPSQLYAELENEHGPEEAMRMWHEALAAEKTDTPLNEGGEPTLQWVKDNVRPPLDLIHGAIEVEKDHAMKYKMPGKSNLTGKDTSTVDLAEEGKRTATTRSRPLGKVGDIITFEGRPQRYRITGVEQLTEENTKDPNWVKQWSQKEQWTEDYFKSILGRKNTVKVGSYQTSFERVETEAKAPPAASIPVEFNMGHLVEPTTGKDVTSESIMENIHSLYDRAAADPTTTYHVDLSGDPKAKVRLSDKSTLSMVKIAAMMDSRPIPFNVKLSDKFMSLLQNTPRRFLNSLLFDDRSMYHPLGYNDEVLAKQIKEMFVPARDSSDTETGVFDAERQTEIVDNVVQAIKTLMDSGKAANLSVEGYKDRVKNDVFKMMRDKYARVAGGETIKGMEAVNADQARQRTGDFDQILRSFDTPGLNFWELAINKLKALNISVKENGRGISPDSMPTFTVDGEDPLTEATFHSSESHGLRDWSDVSFETDPKDTASGRMKMFLATTPDSTVGPEEQPREVKLSFTDPKIRGKITSGQKTFTTRTPDQAQAMGLREGEDVTTKVDGKLMRVTPIRKMDANDVDIHKGTAEEEGTIAAEGDMLLQLQPYKPKDNVLTTNRNYLGLAKLVDYEQLFESAIGKLAGQERSIDNYIVILRNEGNRYNPNLRALAEKLDRAPTEIKNEFVSVMTLQYQPFTMMLLDSRKDESGKGYYVLRSIDANRGSQLNVITEGWQQNQKFSPILTKNSAGITVVDRVKAQELKDELSALNEAYNKGDAKAPEKSIALLRKTLDYNGITMPDKAIDSFVSDTLRWTKKTSVAGDFRRQFALSEDGRPLGVISSMIQKLAGVESTNDNLEEMEDKTFQLSNPLYSEKTSMTVLARVAAAHTAQLYSNTHTSSEGKNIYDYGFNSSLSNGVRRIKGDPEFRGKFQDVDIARKSWLLGHLNTNPDLRERFQLTYLDGIKVAYMPGASGTTRPEMSDREQHLTAVGLFQNQGDAKFAHYLSLTHSDKSTTPVFRNSPRITEVTTARMVNDKLSGQPRAILQISEEAIGHLRNVFDSEYDRITRAGQVKDYNNPKYEAGASHFLFLPQMNFETMKADVAAGRVPAKIFEKIWAAGSDQLNVKEAPGFKEAVQWVLTRHVDALTNSTLEEWKKNGIVGEGDTPFDRKYLNRILSPVGIYSKKLTAAEKAAGELSGFVDRNNLPLDGTMVHNLAAQLSARDFALNSYLMNVSMSQLFYGDPAQTWKGSVDKTMVEYGKRLAKDIAPGRELGFPQGATYTTITARDFKTNAPYLAEIEGLKKAYAEGHPLESTDAQELTTVQEHIDIMHAAGRITDKVYQDMSKIIKDANGKYYEFTDKLHRQVILQAQKPVYAGDRAPINGAMLNDYIKSSAYPLYPPFLVGKEMDKVRTAMEKGNVQRINFETAHKIGVPSDPVELFNDKGEVNEDVFKSPAWTGTDKGSPVASARQELSRDNFRIQQEVPYDEDKDSIRTVSQMNKLITQGLSLIKTPFSYQGREMSGEGLALEKENIRKQLFTMNRDELLTSIGAHLDEEGRVELPNNDLLFEKLQNMALEGNLGFTANDLAYLQPTNRVLGTDELAIPLMYAPNAQKFEAMLMSMVGDIGNVKMPGKSYIQASPAGHQYESVKKWENMGEEEKKNIVWVGDYTGGALKTARIEDGVLKPAQVILPFNFQRRGHNLDIRQFLTTGEDGRQTLDPSRVPPELLQLIGARIPNQGHNSMLPLEIVGFVPPNMGDLVIVPAAITKQMGADFDVDKLYTYRRGYQAEGDGFKAIPHDEQGDLAGKLKNDYFDIHWSVLTHKDMLPSMLNPLDKNDLKDEAASIEKWESKGQTNKPTYYDPVYQLRDFQAQKDAKRLVGLSSLSTTFNAVIQDKNIRPGFITMGENFKPKEQETPVHLIDEDGHRRTLSTLSGYGQSTYRQDGEKVGQSRSKHDNHTTVQSEVLDYAKNKVSDKVHLSTYTYPASAALTQLQEPDNVQGDSKLIGSGRGWSASLKYNARLLSQPIIREFVSEISKRGDSLSGEYTPDMKQAVIDDLLKKYHDAATAAKETPDPDYVVSIQDLTDSLKDPSKVENFNAKQQEALMLFSQLDDIGTAMMTAQSTINHDTRGAGPTLLATLSKETAAARVSAPIDQDGRSQLLGAKDLYDIPGRGTTEQGELFKQIHVAAHGIVGKFFPYQEMMPVFKYLIEHTNRQDLSIDTQKNVFNSVKSYLFANNRLGLWSDAQTARADLLYHRGDNTSLAERVNEAKNSWGQNNYFLQRLQTDIDPDSLHPSYVSYIASKASRLDDYENTKAWLDMFLSPEPQVRKMAEDLVRYTYLTGGIQDARSFVKYTPYSYLIGTDFGNNLREMTKDLGNNIVNENFKTQWFQHNPQFAKGLSPDFREVGSEIGSYPERFTLPPLNIETHGGPDDKNPAKNLVVRTTTEKGILTPQYPDYLSYRSKEENRWILYKKAGPEQYTRIDTLGDSNMDEYAPNKSLTRRSLIPENRSKAYDNLEPASRMLGSPLWPKNGKSTRAKLDIPDRGGKEEMDAILKGFAENPRMPEHVQVLSDFLRHLPEGGPNTDALQTIWRGREAPPLAFEVVTKADMARLASSGETPACFSTSYNRMYINETTSDPIELAGNINHEMIHARTSALTLMVETEDYLKTKGYSPEKIKFLKDVRDKMFDENPGLHQTLSQLDMVRREAQSKLRDYAESKGYHYETEYDKTHAGKNSGDLNRMIYAFSSNTEFVTMAMTDLHTQRWLNDQKFDGKEPSFIQNVINVVKEMMHAIGRAFGYPVAKDSLLEKAMQTSMNLMMFGDSLKRANPDSMSTPDNMEFTSEAPLTSMPINGLDRVIGKLEEQRDEIAHSLTGRLSAEDLADKRSKLDDIESDLAKLNQELGTELVAQIGQKHLGWVENTLKAENPSASQIMTASRVLEVWTNLVDLLYGEGGAKVDPTFAQLYSDARSYRTDLTLRMKNALIDVSDNVLGIRDFNANYLKDIPRGQGLVRGLSSAAESKVTQYVAGYMENIARHRDEDTLRLVHEMRDLEKTMEGLADGKKNLPQFYDKFFQRNADNSAWGFVQRYHQDWYDFRRSLRGKRSAAIEEIDKTMPDFKEAAASKQRVWQQYWKTMNEHAMFADTRLLFDSETGAHKTDDAAQRHRDVLEKELGKDNADEMINQAQDRYKRYLDVKKARFDALDGETAAGDTPLEEADRLKNEFVSRYSPNVFFNNMKNPLSEFKTVNSDYYVKMAPKRYRLDSSSGKLKAADTGFYDQKFEDIQADPKVKAVYDRIKTTLDALKEGLPIHVQQQIGANFMPAIAKSMFTDMIDVPAYIKTMGRRMIDSVTASAHEEVAADNSYNKIPMQFINDNREQLPLESRSRDIPRILEAFGMMALHYKHFADAKDYIDMGETTLKEIDRMRSAGAAQVEQNGKLVTVNDGLRNTLDSLKYMKDYLMFKKSRALEGKTETILYSPNPVTQFKRAHEVKDLVKEREALMAKVISGEVEPGDVSERMGEIDKLLSQEKYQGRRFYGSKFGDKLITVNQLKTLSYNPFSGIANMAFGVVSAAIHANGGADFSWKHLGQAYKMMGHSIMKWGSLGGKETKTAGKILAIMDRLGVIGDVIDSHYGKIESRERKPGWQKAVNPYNWMRSGDYYMKGLTTVAMLLHDKVKVVENGEHKEVSLWESMDENGQWDSKRFGGNKSWQSEDLTEQKDFDKLRNKAIRLNMMIHGNQDKNSPKLANKYILGRLMGQFRMSWLPEGWYSRFQGEREDLQLGRTIKGRYSTIKDLGFLGYAAVTLKQVASIVSKVDPYTGTSRLDGRPLSEVDKENMRRNFAELGFIASMAGTLILLKSAISPDEDDKVRWSLRMLANQLIRNQQDLDFYASPGVFDAVTRNVIPASDVLKDYWKAIKATARVMTDDNYEAQQWIFAITHAGIPIPQATLANKFRTAATKDLDSMQQ